MIGDNVKAKFTIKLGDSGVLEEPSNKNVSVSSVNVATGTHRYDLELTDEYSRSALRNKSPFRLSENVNIPLSELTEKDIRNGGNYLGVHKGVFSDENIDGVKITKLKEILPGSFPSDVKVSEVDGDVHSVNYLFINTPYSTYGALFTNEYDSKLFVGGLNTNEAYGAPFTEKVASKNYVESLKGDLVYKGDVIAVVTKGVKGTRNVTLPEAPKVDGKVTLNAKFEPKFFTVSGHIDSDTLGRIELTKQSKTDNYGLGSLSSDALGAKVLNAEGNNQFVGSYSVQFTGKEYSDVVGGVSLSSDLRTGYRKDILNEQNIYQPSKYNPNIIEKYEAVFGATKQ